MSIRRARVDDIDVLVAMGCRFRQQTEYREILSAESPERMRGLVERLLDQPEDAYVAVQERNGAVVGMIGGFLFDNLYSGERTAIELFWWVNEDARGGGVALWRSFEDWARDIGAVKVQMIAPNRKVGELYERRGYVVIETMYQRSL